MSDEEISSFSNKKFQFSHKEQILLILFYYSMFLFILLVSRLLLNNLYVYSFNTINDYNPYLICYNCYTDYLHMYYTNFKILALIVILVYLISPLIYIIYKKKVVLKEFKALKYDGILLYGTSVLFLIFSAILYSSLPLLSIDSFQPYSLVDLHYANIMGTLPVINKALFALDLLILSWIVLGICLLVFWKHTWIIVQMKKISVLKEKIYYQKTMNMLKSSELADLFVKKFILLQSDEIKAVIPQATAKNLTDLMTNIFKTDIRRLYKIFEINGIEIKSNKALMDYTVKAASPLILELKEKLTLHLTEQLFNKNIDPGNLQADLSVLWPSINKILLQWESLTEKIDFTLY